jgi:hypothetical protein
MWIEEGCGMNRRFEWLRFRPSRDVARIVAVWAAWLIILCGFQAIVAARIEPRRPDAVLAWTPSFTQSSTSSANGSGCHPRLSDPAMNEHVSFDSEYYISIAVAGYDDPQASAYVWSGYNVAIQGVPACTPGMVGHYTPLNFAFMPGYPMTMKGVAAVASVIPGLSGMSEDGLATIAGILVSAVGGLLAMLALARLMAHLERMGKTTARTNGAGAARGSAGSAGSSGSSGSSGRGDAVEATPAEPADEPNAWGGIHGLRAAIYLLIFPTGFYLAQVYTEGLFLGLAFMACAMAVEKRLLAGALFAIAAALTRQVGVFLFIPLAWSAYEVLRDEESRGEDLRFRVPVFAAVAPLVTFVVWYLSPLGRSWQTVESQYFGRSYDPIGSLDLWWKALWSVISGTDKSGIPLPYAPYGGGQLATSTSVYLCLELAALALAVVAGIWLWRRRMRSVALFGFAVLLLSAGSSSGQGMIRYILAVPAIFLMLAWLGRHPIFDRVWTMASTLLMGMLAMLFTFGFWVA